MREKRGVGTHGQISTILHNRVIGLIRTLDSDITLSAPRAFSHRSQVSKICFARRQFCINVKLLVSVLGYSRLTKTSHFGLETSNSSRALEQTELALGGVNLTIKRSVVIRDKVCSFQNVMRWSTPVNMNGLGVLVLIQRGGGEVIVQINGSR